MSGRGLAKVLGVYSPVGRCLKTSFALTIGKLLAQEERVLYLNLEEFSGLSVLMKEEYKSDLSDLLYFYNGGSYNSLRLSILTHFEEIGFFLSLFNFSAAIRTLTVYKLRFRPE